MGSCWLSNPGGVLIPATAVQAERTRELFVRIGVWGAVLLGLILVLLVFVYYYRSRVRKTDRGLQQGFTLQSLREMREKGKLTEPEFQRLRARVVADFTGSRDDAAESKPPDSGGDQSR